MCVQIRGANDHSKVKWKIQLQLTRFDTTKNSFCQHLGRFLQDSYTFCQEIEQSTKSAVRFIGKEHVSVPETQLEESQSESQTARYAQD